MSYSFTVKGATKAEALERATKFFDENVVSAMPVHKVDREAALANLAKHLELLGDPADGEEVMVSMHGSVGGDIDWSAGEARRLTNAGSGCSVALVLATVQP